MLFFVLPYNAMRGCVITQSSPGPREKTHLNKNEILTAISLYRHACYATSSAKFAFYLKRNQNSKMTTTISTDPATEAGGNEGEGFRAMRGLYHSIWFRVFSVCYASAMFMWFVYSILEVINYWVN